MYMSLICTILGDMWKWVATAFKYRQRANLNFWQISSLHHPHVLHTRPDNAFRYLRSSSRHSHHADQGEDAGWVRCRLPGTDLSNRVASISLTFHVLKDLISRFTLDSASEFLFGVNIGSLSNVLPYPHNTSARPVIQSNTADDFATAFGKAQFVASQRARIGCLWPLFEIFQDKTAEHMEVVNAFLLVNLGNIDHIITHSYQCSLQRPHPQRRRAKVRVEARRIEAARNGEGR